MSTACDHAYGYATRRHAVALMGHPDLIPDPCRRLNRSLAVGLALGAAALAIAAVLPARDAAPARAPVGPASTSHSTHRPR